MKATGNMNTEFYVTTFCNFAHNTKTGRPIGHECYILPPDAIKAERDGDIDKAIEILARKGKGSIVRGRKLTKAPSSVGTLLARLP